MPSRTSLPSATARAALWLWLFLLVSDAVLGCSMVDLGPTETDTSSRDVLVNDASPEIQGPSITTCLFEAACVLGDPSLIVRAQNTMGSGTGLCEVSAQPCPTGTGCAFPAADDETCTPNQAACLPLVETCGGSQDSPCPADQYCEFTAFACAADALLDCATNPVGFPNTCTYAQLGGYGVCRARPTSCPDDGEPTAGCDGVAYANACQRRAAGASPEQCSAVGVFDLPAWPPANFCPGYTTMEAETATLRGGFSANLGAGAAWSESGTHRLVLGARPHLRGSL